jgi:hypothetical protein
MENTTLRKILTYALEINAKIECQYVDYDENTWTIPRCVNQKLTEEILCDKSIKKIRLIIDPNRL